MHMYETNHHPHQLNLILSNIPYQGGGDYRGIYDIGLLLNAPYKIDSMMEMRLM
jgi:hypothetical protein